MKAVSTPAHLTDHEWDLAHRAADALTVWYAERGRSFDIEAFAGLAYPSALVFHPDDLGDLLDRGNPLTMWGVPVAADESVDPGTVEVRP